MSLGTVVVVVVVVSKESCIQTQNGWALAKIKTGDGSAFYCFSSVFVLLLKVVLQSDFTNYFSLIPFQTGASHFSASWSTEDLCIQPWSVWGCECKEESQGYWPSGKMTFSLALSTVNVYVSSQRKWHYHRCTVTLYLHTPLHFVSSASADPHTAHRLQSVCWLYFNYREHSEVKIWMLNCRLHVHGTTTKNIYSVLNEGGLISLGIGNIKCCPSL